MVTWIPRILKTVKFLKIGFPFLLLLLSYGILVTKIMNFSQNLIFFTNFKIDIEYHKLCTLFGITQTSPNKIFLSKSYFKSLLKSRIKSHVENHIDLIVSSKIKKTS